MKIVGFQSGHDVSYAILENGVPVIHEELERFTREKEPLGDGLEFFFKQNPNMDDVKHFTFGNPGGRSGKWVDECYSQWSQDKMEDMVSKNNGKYHMIGHHQSHAANAFYSSNFEESLIITIDGGGTEEDGSTTSFTVWNGKGNKIEPVKIIPLRELNIGSPWRKYTGEIFGLSNKHPKGNQAGTVMGMACVGEPKYTKDFYDAFTGHLWQVESGRGNFNPGDLCQAYRPIADRSEQDKFDIAASLQLATEKLVRELMTPFVSQSKMKNLCLSGGVALNSVMVGKMYEWFDGIIENIYVDPIPYDGGLALGSARYVWHHILDNPRIEWKDNSSSYLGRTYNGGLVKQSLDNSTKILDDLDKHNCKLKYSEATDDDVIELLSKDDNVISVFGGGSESGRRALGNRSILADPRSPKMKDIINEKVKHRQWFRPFAPSIIREEVKNWFKRDIDSPYMSFVLDWKDDMKDKVPAVVHLDGTARLQTVTENDNKWYYNFIKKFGEKTGVPIVLNTSFNDREPIVETPEHAINCFLGTDIDYLYFYDENILVEKVS
tara:strand:+ start:1695 stop:3344 length:1650 start_codon:yes stop_codon:yes gene_type:complete